MGSGVHQPGGVEAEDGAKEDAPEEIWPSAEDQEKQAEGGDGDPMPAAYPDVEFVFAKVGDVREECGRIVMYGLASQQPAYVGPEAAIVGGVGIAFFVSVLMMHAMDGYPEDRATFQSQRSADGEKVLHPFECLVTAVSEEPMVAHAYAEASGKPPQEYGYEKRLPTEHEERGHCTDMKRDHYEDCQPNNGLREGAIVPEQLWGGHMLIRR